MTDNTRPIPLLPSPSALTTLQLQRVYVLLTVRALWPTIPHRPAPSRLRPVAASVCAAVGLSLIGWGIGSADPSEGLSAVKRQIVACKEPDGSGQRKPCAWDAKHRGDGKGKSYLVRKNGSRDFIKHKRAHRLTFDWAYLPKVEG